MHATDSATGLAAAVRRRDVGSVELLDLYLNRIDHLGGDIHAVVTLDVDRARAACTAADDAVARGDDLGPLHGLPITVKDAIETAGIRSTGGAVELTDHVPADDAPVVAQVKGAGAIVFGKTNLPRWSGDLQSYNEIFGTTNNPWDTSRVPGGSSGGPAAAVACGFTSFEIGTDIGGSIRIPSHFCGTFGLKPSFGVVSQRGYLDRVGGGTTDADINVFGPMARSAEDLDMLLDVMAGPDADRSVAWRLELPRSTVDSLAGVRVAVWFDEPAYPIDAEYRSVLGHAADALADAGATVETAHPPVDMAEQVALFMAMIGPAVSPSMPADVAQAVSGWHLDWLRIEQQRAAVRARWAEWFADWDVLLCPVTPTPAFRHDQEGDLLDRTIDVNGKTRPYLDNIAWTGLIGIVGLPSAVPPLGPTASGLPVGVQVVAPYLHDRTAVRVAGLIAETVDGAGYRVPPGFEAQASAGK
jgi:amidase